MKIANVFFANRSGNRIMTRKEKERTMDRGYRQVMSEKSDWNLHIPLNCALYWAIFCRETTLGFDLIALVHGSEFRNRRLSYDNTRRTAIIHFFTSAYEEKFVETNLSISELISRSLSADPRLSPASEEPGRGEAGGGGEVEKYSREIFPFLRSTSSARAEYRDGDGMGVSDFIRPCVMRLIKSRASRKNKR